MQTIHVLETQQQKPIHRYLYSSNTATKLIQINYIAWKE